MTDHSFSKVDHDPSKGEEIAREFHGDCQHKKTSIEPTIIATTANQRPIQYPANQKEQRDRFQRQ
jgi:hypothetical protein